MESLEARTQEFLREFFSKTESLVRDLIAENERLRSQLEATRPVENERVVLEKLVGQLDVLEQNCAELRKLIGVAQAERGTAYQHRFEALEAEHYRLAAMYVAGNQFYASTTLDEVLRTVTEIMLNFIGVGRFTVLAMDEERQVLFPIVREGGGVAECEEIALPAVGSVAAALEQPSAWRCGGTRASGAGVLMHLPLRSGTRLMGMVRLESFLPQKIEFTAEDDALLELVSEQAGVGVEAAWVRIHANKEIPIGRSAMERLLQR